MRTIILCLMMLMLFSVAATAGPTMPYIIKGCIEDQDGDPIEGIEVVAENMDQGGKVTDDTNEDGYYQITNQDGFEVSDGDEIRISFDFKNEYYEEYIRVDRDDTSVVEIDFVVEDKWGWGWQGYACTFLMLSALIGIGIFKYRKANQRMET